MLALARYSPAALILLAAATSFSFAQQPPAAKSDQPAAKSDQTGEINRKAAVKKKRVDCRKDGRDRGLRAADLVDHVAVCVQEARLACLKQAIEQKARGTQRATFIAKCLGS